jgi:hypothetical protein
VNLDAVLEHHFSNQFSPEFSKNIQDDAGPSVEEAKGANSTEDLCQHIHSDKGIIITTKREAVATKSLKLYRIITGMCLCSRFGDKEHHWKGQHTGVSF